MSMEIQGPSGLPPSEIGDQSGAASARARHDTPQGNATAVSTGGSDKVSLTNEAAQLKALESQISSLPVVDTDRVNEVQRVIATGEFTVDPGRVAEKMLQFEAGLAAPSR